MNSIRLVGYPGIELLSDGRQVSGVSRVLKTNQFNWESVVFQQGRPILDSELNLIQAISNEKLRKFAQIITRNGWTTLPSGADSDNPTRAKFNAFKMLFLGREITLDDGNGQVSVDLGNIIQQNSRTDGIYMVFHLEEVAAPGENTRFRESIKLHGNLNGGILNNDMLDPALPTGVPTTRRVQNSYRVIASVGTNWESLPAVNVDGQITPEYSFSSFYDAENKYYRAGDGSQTAADRLGTADGYVYLVPLFNVDRTSIDTGIDAAKVTPVIGRASMVFGGRAFEVSVNPLPGINAVNVQEALSAILAKIEDARREADENINLLLDEVMACCSEIKTAVDVVNEKLQLLLDEVSA